MVLRPKTGRLPEIRLCVVFWAPYNDPEPKQTKISFELYVRYLIL